LLLLVRSNPHQEMGRRPRQPAYPGKVDAKADVAPRRATKREQRRPSTMEGFFVSETTLIQPDKIRAYLATDYHMGHAEADTVLRVGAQSPGLAALFAAQGVGCGAFITAYNPRGQLQSDRANDRAHIRLAERLADLDLTTVEGSGSEKGSDWPAERSYFAFGLDLEAAKAMGLEFDQDAIVWAGPDAVPRLVLLR
jgi:hypothetical protein